VKSYAWGLFTLGLVLTCAACGGAGNKITGSLQSPSNSIPSPASASPTPTPSPAPTASPAPGPTPTPGPISTPQPTPTPTPTQTPMSTPSATPTPMPVSGSAGATATQYILSYAAANSNQCQIEVSENPSFSPAIHAVDQSLFKNANLDGQTTTGSRVFVVGQKWITQENVVPPSITVGTASRPTASKLVTVNYPNQPFVAGDNITITGMSNAAYNDSWARVDVASSNSISYETLTAAPTGGDSSGGGFITRANRYSLALATDTTYYYRIGGPSNTCGASPATGTFTTMNIPNGNTWEEAPVTDNNGLQIEPSIPENRAASIVDPLTGTKVHRISLFSDSNSFARGWSSSFYRSCSLTPSGNGFYHCVVGLGESGVGGFYSFKDTGETHWLGFINYNYSDSNGHHCCQQGTNPYMTAQSSLVDTSNGNIVYGLQATNAGYPPSKNVIVSTSFTGSDTIDTAPVAIWANGGATALTPDPSNTLDDKLSAFDSTFNSAVFHGCELQEVTGDYLTGQCSSFDQGSPTWGFAYKISTASVIALGANFKNPQTRWCGSHGAGSTGGSTKWMSDSSAYLIGGQTGEWHATLRSSVTSNTTSLSVTAPTWLASTAYNNNGSAAGFGVVDSNGNLEVASTAGTSGLTKPIWSLIAGGTTTDGTVIWINKGAASQPNEPQNIFPSRDSMGNYWSFLMPVAGAVGAGGEFNGDLFHFEDGTNECVRIVTVGGSGIWSGVIRAVNGNGLVGCSATASPHAAGASLRALCEEGSEASAHSLHEWDFADDPHMADSTNTYYTRINMSAGHGYTRQAAPHSWNTFLVNAQHDPFIGSDFTGNPVAFSILSNLTFNGLLTTQSGVAHQDYTTWDFENASFKDSAIGSLFFVTGGGAGSYGGFNKMVGASTLYKYALGSGNNGVPFNYTLPYIASSGGNTLKDISGPNSLLTDSGATPEVCVTVVAGECRPGSLPGDMYANLPVVDPTSKNLCNDGGENNSYLGHDWCMMNTSTFGDAINQYGLAPANFIGYYPNPPHWAEYGAGLSRRLVQNMAGGLRLQSSHPHTVPDGSGILFESCVGDPHITTNGGGGADTYGCQTFLASIPPQPPADGIDRTNFENVSVNILPSFGGATHARVKYGYEENEPVRSPTWPRTIHFYCTQYKGTCYSDQNLPLNSKAILPMGVPQRVLYYQVEYLDSSNTVVATDPVTTTAIP